MRTSKDDLPRYALQVVLPVLDAVDLAPEQVSPSGSVERARFDFNTAGLSAPPLGRGPGDPRQARLSLPGLPVLA